jgi:signal transduction histidine kinase
MPHHSLCILTCATLSPELDAIAASMAGSETGFRTFPSRCGRPPLAWDDLHHATSGLACGHLHLLGGSCLSGLGAGDPAGRCTTTAVDNCFRIVAGGYAVDSYIKEGGYLVTPGWLRNWRRHIEAWGFDRGSAREFFGESCRKIVLLDTGVCADALSNLEEFSEFVARPHQKVPVGLDLMRSFVERIIQEWRGQEQATRASEYAIAIDLLGSIERMLDEDEVIERIFTFYATLFGAARLEYVVVADGKPLRVLRRGLQVEAGEEAVLGEVASLTGDHRLLDDSGFLVAVRHDGATIGAIRATGITLPRYRDQYLNLALATSGVWGLVLNNARSFQHISEMTRKLEAQQQILTGINRIFAVALSTGCEEELGRTCLEVAEEITGSRYGFIGEIGDGELLNNIAISATGWDACRAGDGSAAAVTPRGFPVRGVYRGVLRDGATVLANTPSRHPDSVGVPVGHPEVLSFLGVPLKEEDRVTGMIALGNRPGGYGAEQQEAVEALAPAVVAALRRRRAEVALQQAKELLEERVAERTRELADREMRRIQAERSLHQETLERLRVSESLREKERLLIQQSRLAALGEMINNIAHQWRQPLNQVGLIIQELQMEFECTGLEEVSLDQKVRKVMHLLRHMSQTVDDFRNFFRPDKEMVRFRVREVVARALALVEESFKASGIGVRIDAQSDPEVWGHPNEYAQVLVNILLNARDAFLGQGEERSQKITIAISEPEGRSLVTVSDTAGGIPEEILPKIFDPYFTTKGPEQGTGLGLYMSKMIIDKNMNGSLTVRNAEQGAEFSIHV